MRLISICSSIFGCHLSVLNEIVRLQSKKKNKTKYIYKYFNQSGGCWGSIVIFFSNITQEKGFPVKLAKNAECYRGKNFLIIKSFKETEK